MYWLTGYDTLRLLLLPMPRRGGGRAHGAPDPLGRSAPGAAHLEHRGHPHLEGRRRRQSGARPQGRSPPSSGSPASASASSSRATGSSPRTAGSSRRPSTASRTLADASHLVTRLRAVKSAEEIAYVRRAGGARRTRPTRRRSPMIRAGADEGDILAAQHAAIFRGGGDYPGNEFIIGSGARRAALPLQGRPAHARDARPDHARIRRRLPALPRRDHAHRAWSATRSPPTSPITAPPARRSSPARPSSGPAARRATSSRRMPASSTSTASARTGSTPAATRSARSSRPPGWTGRCSTRRNPWVIEPGMVVFAHMILMDSGDRDGDDARPHLARRRARRRGPDRARPGPRDPLSLQGTKRNKARRRRNDRRGGIMTRSGRTGRSLSARRRRGLRPCRVPDRRRLAGRQADRLREHRGRAGGGAHRASPASSPRRPSPARSRSSATATRPATASAATSRPSRPPTAAPRSPSSGTCSTPTSAAPAGSPARPRSRPRRGRTPGTASTRRRWRGSRREAWTRSRPSWPPARRRSRPRPRTDKAASRFRHPWQSRSLVSQRDKSYRGPAANQMPRAGYLPDVMSRGTTERATGLLVPADLTDRRSN